MRFVLSKNRPWYTCPIITPPASCPEQKHVTILGPPIVIIGDLLSDKDGFLHIKISSFENDKNEVIQVEEFVVEALSEMIQVL